MNRLKKKKKDQWYRFVISPSPKSPKKGFAMKKGPNYPPFEKREMVWYT